MGLPLVVGVRGATRSSAVRMRIAGLASSAVLPPLLSAQITFTSADLPQPGEVWQLHTDMDGGAAFIPTPPGPGQSWDWSSSFDQVSSGNFLWVSPAGLPGADAYPDANLAMDAEGNVSFFRSDASGLHELGSRYDFGSFSATEFSENAVILPTPFTMGSTRTVQKVTTAYTVFGNGSPAMKSVRRSTTTITCDAWGDLRTPAYPSGTDVLRLRIEETGHVDSSFLDMSGNGNGPWEFSMVDTYDDYLDFLFVHDGVPALVAGTDGAGTEANWFSGAVVDGFPERDARLIAPEVFPVPVGDEVLNIRPGTRQAAWLEVYDGAGRQVRRVAMRGADLVRLNTTGLKPGVYSLRCLDDHGVPTGRTRFAVER